MPDLLTLLGIIIGSFLLGTTSSMGRKPARPIGVLVPAGEYQIYFIYGVRTLTEIEAIVQRSFPHACFSARRMHELNTWKVEVRPQCSCESGHVVTFTMDEVAAVGCGLMGIASVEKPLERRDLSVNEKEFFMP